MQFGKYQLIEKIGEGGLSEVYFAQNNAPETYSRELVIKQVHRRLTQDEEFVEQFALAAEQGTFLNHHNIAQTYDSGFLDDTWFVAQEYIDGISLEDILARHEQRLKAIPIEITLEIILQICEALTYAYWARDDRGRQLHLVHRNLKPSNIMVNRHGVVKVLDFGLINAGQNMAAGQGSLLLRMAAYMSPEQAKGEEVDNRSDIYSLGVIFYEMLTLKPLFCMDNPLQTLRMVQEGRCEEQLDELSKHPLGQGLLPLLRSMLGASPWDRPTEAKQLIPHLRGILGRLHQQIYLPNWVQEEISTLSKRRAIPVPSDNTAEAAEQGGGTPPPPTHPSPSSADADEPAPPPSQPSTPPGNMAGSFSGASLEEGLRKAKDTFTRLFDGAFKDINRVWIAAGFGVLMTLFLILVAVFALSGRPEAGADPAVIHLKVTSTPTGAHVTLVGTSIVRTTPTEFEVPAAAKKVELIAQLPDYETERATVYLAPGIPNEHHFVLEEVDAGLATLEVHVFPTNAVLFVDGERIEGEETFLFEVKSGVRHVLRAEAPGYMPAEETILMEPQGFRQIRLVLDLDMR